MKILLMSASTLDFSVVCTGSQLQSFFFGLL